ncbi:MAG: hypothetical protein IKJ23_08020 [Bacteroidaceae bacterium]|nr:hypothetical protein [Bacteroidaceae bacterium]
MMRIAAVLYYLGALALFTGLVLRMFMPDFYAYVYSAGALLFAVMQFVLRPHGKGLSLRRLVFQQQLAGALFIVTGVLMFTHVRNEWLVALTCAVLVELYTAYRIPQELEKEKK